jgi:hypothetical protein
VHDGEGERDRDGGVDRVAAAAQNVYADLARERVRRDDHRVLSLHRFDA